MTEYVVVFDARSVPLVRWTDLAPLAVAAVLLGVFWARRLGRAPGAPRHPFVDHPARVGVAAALAVLASAAMAAGRYTDAAHLRGRLEQGRYVVVEGRVAEFVPGDRGGHRDESWAVRSGDSTYRYRYRWSVEVPGFHQSAGPVRQGLRVRVADVDGRIARLEIERGGGDAYENR